MLNANLQRVSTLSPCFQSELAAGSVDGFFLMLVCLLRLHIVHLFCMSKVCNRWERKSIFSASGMRDFLHTFRRSACRYRTALLLLMFARLWWRHVRALYLMWHSCNVCYHMRILFCRKSLYQEQTHKDI